MVALIIARINAQAYPPVASMVHPVKTGESMEPTPR
jgi:hypothetical protein